MKRRYFLKGLGATSLVLCGCGSDTTDTTGFSGSRDGNAPSIASPRLILDPQQAVATGGLRLAAESTVESRAVPLLGGAILVNVDALTTLTEAPGALSDLGSLQSFFAALGVRRDQPVVVYDDGEMRFGARVRFLLGYCGVAQPLLVNGGAPGLTGLLPVQPGSATTSSFQATPTPTPIVLVFQQQVLQAIGKGSGVKLLDVRTPAEFSGQLLLPGDARPGHIPGAINVPEGNFLNGLQLRPPDQISGVFTTAGLSPSDDVIVYCHDGAKSSLVATLLVESGFARTSLYYLSYRDWSQNPSLPVEI